MIPQIWANGSGRDLQDFTVEIGEDRDSMAAKAGTATIEEVPLLVSVSTDLAGGAMNYGLP
jgi:hypothetical protein